MSRTRRSALILASGYLSSGVIFLTALLTAPVLIRLLGEERYGASKALNDWAAYLGLLEVGVAGALQAAFAAALAGGDRERTRTILATAGRTYLRLAVAYLVGASALAALAPRLIPVRPDLAGELVGAAVILAASAAAFPVGLCRWLIDADQRGYLVNLQLTVQSLAGTGLALVFAWLGYGLPGQVAAITAAGLATQFWLARQAAARHPDLFRRPFPPRDRAVEAQLARLNWPSVVYGLAIRLSLYTDTMILAAVLGPVAVVPYFLTVRLPVLAGVFVASVANATWAGLAELHHQGKTADRNRRLVQLTLLVGVLAGSALTPCVAANREFIRMWIGEGQYAGDAVTAATTTYVWCQAVVQLWTYAVQGTGNLRQLLPCLLTGTALNVAVSVAATVVIGPVGPALGSVVQFAVVNLIWMPWLLRRTFGVSVRSLAWAVAAPAGLGLAYAAGLYALVPAYLSGPLRSLPPAAQWVALPAGMAVAGAGYAALAFGLVLGRADRREVVATLRGLVRGGGR